MWWPKECLNIEKEVKELFDKGLSQREIAKRLNIKEHQVQYIVDKNKWKREKQEVINKKELEQKLLVELKSRNQVAKELGVSSSVITRLVKKYGIKELSAQQKKEMLSRASGTKKYDYDKEFLYDRFIIQNKTIPEIAVETGMSEGNVGRLLKKWNIQKPRKLAAQRTQETQKERYGGTGFQLWEDGSYPFQDPEWQTKARKIRDKKYPNNEIGNKISETWAKKDAQERKEILDKSKETNISKYGVPNIKFLNVDKAIETKEQMLDIIAAIGEKPSYSEIADFCGYATTAPIIRKVHDWGLEDYIHLSKSDLEEKVANFLSGNGISYIRNDRKIIAPKELDFVLEEQKVALEVNDIWTHNSSDEVFGKPKEYHKTKTALAREKGYRLIHIFEWEIENLPVVLSSILPKKRIYARKTEVRDVPPLEAKEFLDKFHRQKAGSYATINKGLYYKGELVEIMNFRKPRNNTRGDMELYRLCSKSDVIVVGGASKLFKSILEELDVDSVYSYCNLTTGSGGVYEVLGFELVGESTPNYKWVDKRGKNILTREATMKHKLVEQGFDPNMTEKQIMESRGFKQIFDSGNQIWYYNNREKQNGCHHTKI